MEINILFHRTSFGQVEDFHTERAVKLLFGSGVIHDYFNDDVLAGSLDRIHAAGPKKVFSTVVLQARLREDLSYLILHGDTTARLVYGAYLEENGFNITFISRLPVTFNFTRELISTAFASGSWNELGRLSPGKESAFYSTQVFTRKLRRNQG